MSQKKLTLTLRKPAPFIYTPKNPFHPEILFTVSKASHKLWLDPPPSFTTLTLFLLLFSLLEMTKGQMPEYHARETQCIIAMHHNH